METIDLVCNVLTEHQISYYILDKYEHLPYHLVSLVGGYLTIYKESPLIEVWISGHVMRTSGDIMLSSFSLNESEFHIDYLLNRINLLAEEHEC